jgi:phenolic acid decarboxylase
MVDELIGMDLGLGMAVFFPQCVIDHPIIICCLILQNAYVRTS